MAGTFIIRGATSVSSNVNPGGTTPWGGGNVGSAAARPTTDTDLLLGINSLASQTPSLFAGWVTGEIAPIPIGTWLARFGFALGDAVIALDGNPAISFNSLPSGIVVLTATLRITVGRYVNVTSDGLGTLFFQQGTLTESADLGQNNLLAGTIKSFAYNFSPASNGSFLDVILDGFGIRCVFATGGSVGQAFWDARIVGTYDIIAFTWTIDTPNPVSQGDEVTISSDPTDPLALQLDELELSLQYTDTSGEIHTVIPEIVEQTANLLIFIVPVGIDPISTIMILAEGNGVQFSGSVTLGSRTILYANASGIYVITPSKRNDTIYDRAHTDTAEVKIPNPFAKTGFIGG